MIGSFDDHGLRINAKTTGCQDTRLASRPWLSINA